MGANIFLILSLKSWRKQLYRHHCNNALANLTAAVANASSEANQDEEDEEDGDDHPKHFRRGVKHLEEDENHGSTVQ